MKTNLMKTVGAMSLITGSVLGASGGGWLQPVTVFGPRVVVAAPQVVLAPPRIVFPAPMVVVAPAPVVEAPAPVVETPAPVVEVVAPAPAVEVVAPVMIPETYVWDGIEYVGFVGGQYMYLGPGDVWMVCDPVRLERFHGWARYHPDWAHHAIRNEHYRTAHHAFHGTPGGGPSHVTPGGGPSHVTPGGGPSHVTPGGGPSHGSAAGGAPKSSAKH